MFKGSFVALITPFKNGSVNEKKLVELVEWQIAEGIAGLVPVGTTGETATLSMEEHIRVVEMVVKAARKRVPVIAGAGSNSTKEAISLTHRVKEVGADAVLSVNPYYNRPTQEGLVAHFAAIAQETDLPIILYNIPYRTGVTLLPETLQQLVKDNKNIVGIKESTGSMDQTSEIRQRLGDAFCILSGDDSLTLPLMSLGATGVISVVANLVPKAVTDLCNLILAGKYDEARKAHIHLFPLIKAMFIESNPSPIKAAMFEAGLIDDESLRLPMVTIKADTRQKVVAAMKEFGVKIPVGAR